MQITYQIGMMDKGLETLFNDNILQQKNEHTYFLVLMQQIGEQSELKKKELKKLSKIEVNDREGVILTNIVFSLAYLFEAKPSQMPYCDNDYEDNTEEKPLLISTSQRWWLKHNQA